MNIATKVLNLISIVTILITGVYIEIRFESVLHPGLKVTIIVCLMAWILTQIKMVKPERSQRIDKRDMLTNR